MDNPRKYGAAPFNTAVVHGGPGAGGEMAPVARRLSAGRGVLEPIQTQTTLEGQIEELKTTLEQHADSPLTLIGYSWGAWLSWITAARYPNLVQKLILISSGPFNVCYVADLEAARLQRLSAEEREEFPRILQALNQPETADKDALLARLGMLAAKTDNFDPLPHPAIDAEAGGPSGAVFQGVWNKAAKMRKNGMLLKLAEQIRCPVTAIHGDYDPHPAEGVQKPLASCLENFRFILLAHCGHTPWIERRAREPFYTMLEAELV